MNLYNPIRILYLKEDKETWSMTYSWLLKTQTANILYILDNKVTCNHYDLKIIQKFLKKPYKHDPS